MKTAQIPFILILIVILLPFGGCGSQETDQAVEEVLQLENDILEDPLLRELDALEDSLIRDAAVPEPALAPAEAASAMEQAKSVPQPAETTLTPAAQPAPAVTEAAAPVKVEPDKQVYFGVVRKVSDSGIALQIIEAKALTADELRRLKNGEKIPLTLLTENMLTLRYTPSTVFEKVVDGSSVPAIAADVAKGQRVRVSLNLAGNIRTLRILRY